MKEKVLSYLKIFFVVFLPIFMFGIFGPTEIFFANYKELGFLFGDFGIRFLVFGLMISLALSLILYFVPRIVRKPMLTLVWGFSIAGYIQTMFLNNDLSEIGEAAEKYSADTNSAIINILVWALILVIAFVLSYIPKKDVSNKIVVFSSIFLLAVQFVGYVSLFVTADSRAFQYEDEEYCLNASEQYTVSANQNIILFVLDNFSSTFYDWALEEYPELPDTLQDFTYYNNTCCNYHGTYPSLAHMITGHSLDTGLSTDEWLYDCWKNDTTNHFYGRLHEENYTVHLYTPITNLLTGTYDLQLMNGRIDNISLESQSREVDHALLNRTLLEMSCYRFLPKFAKGNFDVTNDQYSGIVSYPGNEIQYSNPNFYSRLVEQGLSVDDESNYFIIQHLSGTHETITTADCQYDYENATYATTVKGIFVMLEEYLNQLKELGVYDNSTIIITADHGSESRSSVVFFIKEPHEQHDSMQQTNAPISLHEIVPTVAYNAGLDSTLYGPTIHDFTPDQKIERQVLIRANMPDFPQVPKFDNPDVDGVDNCYRIYKYTGDTNDLNAKYDSFGYNLLPMTDSYY